ncbi:MAG: alpha/beta fold hydrolase [Alphaproteobacteria bacterium]
MMIATVSTATIRGRRQAWRQAGRGHGIVLLHDICVDATAWRAQFADLARDHRVIAWDCPGYGESAPLSPKEPTVADYAAALDDLLATIHAERVALIGAGLGAVIAAAAAKSRPARTAALVLVSAPSRIGGGQAARMLGWLQQRITDPAAFGRAYAAEALSPGTVGGIRDEVGALAAAIPPQGFARACHMMAGTDLAATLHDLQVSVLLIYGERDGLTPPETGTALDTIVRGTVTEIVEGAGHLPQMEAPAPFNRAVRTFLRSARTRM